MVIDNGKQFLTEVKLQYNIDWANFGILEVLWIKIGLLLEAYTDFIDIKGFATKL